MSSTNLSKTSTLLPHSPPHERVDNHDADRPVSLDAFLKNVKRCKLLFGLGLPVCFGLEVPHLVLNILGTKEGWVGLERRLIIASCGSDIAGIVISVGHLSSCFP